MSARCAHALDTDATVRHQAVVLQVLSILCFMSRADCGDEINPLVAITPWTSVHEIEGRAMSCDRAVVLTPPGPDDRAVNWCSASCSE
jgi:hypothetical protein